MFSSSRVGLRGIKAFIGRTSRGFDFLGYQFTPSGLGVAAKTIERFAERLTRLYEQGADAVRIRAYVRHWRRWVTGGLRVHKLDVVTRLENYRVFRLASVFVPHEPGPQRL